MNLTKYILLFCTGLLLWSCSDKDVPSPAPEPGSGEKGGNFYIAFDLVLPESDATRSTTTDSGNKSDSGNVTGTTNENKIESVRIYFVDAANKLLIQTPYDTENMPTGMWKEIQDGTNSTNKKVYIQVKAEDLKTLAGKTFYMLVVANQGTTGFSYNLGATNSEMMDAYFSASSLNADPINDFGGATQSSEEAGQVLPLVSYNATTVDAFKDIDNNADKKNLLKSIRDVFTGTYRDGYVKEFGTVDLEHAVARLDFRDRIPSEKQAAGDKEITKEFTYEIGPSAKKSGIKIELVELQVLNVNNSSYLFRHTIKGDKFSAFGKSDEGESKKLFGDENGGDSDYYNWIYGYDWTTTPSKTTTGFMNTMTPVADTNLHEYTISTVTGATTDAALGKIKISNLKQRTPYGSSTALEDLYYPWRYVTENTIPTVDMMTDEEIYKYATGLAFKFVVLGTDNEPLAYEANPGSDNTKYPDTAITNSTTEGHGDKTITLTMPDGTWQDVDPDPEDGKYYLTYYGFIGHNMDDDQIRETEVEGEEDPETGEMGDGTTIIETVAAPMRYGIVRNNTYQLNINSIKDLPNPQEPKTIWLEIQVKVMPWNVRWDEEVTLY